MACDHTVGRARLLRRTLALAAADFRVVVADATEPPLRPASLAAVVLDAPCSGTGTLRRHPELRTRLAEDALSSFAAVQRRLLDQACGLLARGGFLLYATCSLEPEENGALVGERHLEVVDVAPALPPGLPVVALPTGGVVIAPSELGDGFTVHLLRRA
jgi:16S rRNA (cytosine967-C5)-methyltransferase